MHNCKQNTRQHVAATPALIMTGSNMKYTARIVQHNTLQEVSTQKVTSPAATAVISLLQQQ